MHDPVDLMNSDRPDGGVDAGASNVYDRVTAFIGKAVGYGGLLGSVLLLSYEVVSRYVFNAPTKFSLEYGLICQILIAALSSAYVLQKGGHVGIDIVLGKLPRRARARLTIVNQVCGALFCLLLAWIMYRAAAYAWKMGSVTETMEMTIAPLYYLFVVGLLMLSGQFVSQLLKLLRRREA